MEFLDGLPGFLAGGHADKGEAARAAREFVEDQVNGGDGAGLGKQVLEVLRGGGERNVAHV